MYERPRCRNSMNQARSRPPFEFPPDLELVHPPSSDSWDLFSGWQHSATESFPVGPRNPTLLPRRCPAVAHQILYIRVFKKTALILNRRNPSRISLKLRLNDSKRIFDFNTVQLGGTPALPISILLYYIFSLSPPDTRYGTPKDQHGSNLFSEDELDDGLASPAHSKVERCRPNL